MLLRVSAATLILFSFATSSADAGAKTPDDIKRNPAARSDARLDGGELCMFLSLFSDGLWEADFAGVEPGTEFKDGEVGTFGLSASEQNGKIMLEEGPPGASFSFRLGNGEEVVTGTFDERSQVLALEPVQPLAEQQLTVRFYPEVFSQDAAVVLVEFRVGETSALQRLSPLFTAAAPFVNCQNGVVIESSVSLCNPTTEPVDFRLFNITGSGGFGSVQTLEIAPISCGPGSVSTPVTGDCTPGSLQLTSDRSGLNQSTITFGVTLGGGPQGAARTQGFAGIALSGPSTFGIIRVRKTRTGIDTGIAMASTVITTTVDVLVESDDQSVQEVGSFQLGDSATRSQFFWEYVGLDVEEFDGTFIFTSTADLAVNSLETLDGLPTASLPVTTP